MHFQWKLFGFRQEYIRRGNENYLLVRDTFQLDLLWIKYWRQKFSLNWSNENLDLGQSFFDKFVKNSLYLTKSHFARKHFYLFTFLHATFSWLGTRIFFRHSFLNCLLPYQNNFCEFFSESVFLSVTFFWILCEVALEYEQKCFSEIVKFTFYLSKRSFWKNFFGKNIHTSNKFQPLAGCFSEMVFYCLRRAW